MAEITNIAGEPVGPGKKVTVILEYDPISGKLNIGGELDNLDRVLNILGQALRHFDSTYRFWKAAALKGEVEQDKQLRSMITQ